MVRLRSRHAIASLRAALIGAVALTTLATIAKPAPAQTPVGDAAKPTYTAARNARKIGNWPGCYRQALAAWNIEQHLTIAGTLGDCAFDIKRYDEAASYLRYYLDNKPADANPKLVAYVEQRLNLAEQQVARVWLSPTIDAAQVSIDGNTLQRINGDSVYLNPGKHRFEARHPGHQTVVIEQLLMRATTQTIAFALTPTNQQPPATSGGPAGWMLGAGYGLAGSGIVAGVVFATIANTKADEAAGKSENSCAAPDSQGCADYLRLKRSQSDYANASILTLVGGGSLAVATTLYLLLTFDNGDDAEAIAAKPRLHVAPIVSRGVGGAVLLGTF